MDYADGFVKPTSTDISTQELYYRSIFGIYTNMMPAHGALAYPYCTPQTAGHNSNKIRNIYGGTSDYNGQWVWDSSFCAFGLVAGCQSGECLNDLFSIQKNWEKYTFKNNENFWGQELHPDGRGILDATSGNMNVPGLWAMVSYLKSSVACRH